MDCGLPTDCCIVFDLRKGAKIIGVICLSFSLIFSIFLLSYLCSDFDNIAKEISENEPHMTEQLHSSKSPPQVTAGFLLAILILYFFSSIFLIKGAHNKTKKFLFPFLVCTIVMIITSLVIAILQFNTVVNLNQISLKFHKELSINKTYKMARALDNFFCCLDLSLGGLIMGWWGMIASAISLISLVLSLLFGGQTYITNLFHIGTGGTVAGAIVLGILLIVYFYFSYQLLLGSQNGNSSQMVGYLVIHGIFILLFIIGAFANLSTLIMAGLYVYLWICIYSLYVKTGGSGVV
ncbi:hypothetical protein PVAND_007740 [Polypedilum vanderplanki]|uniref:Uncharacterized protein n=1 Tax=Polypedilum vanderplanki TaxID=319348 RepID=A0A9J6C7I9_POLVA|nr:hypothetical protein PVAND_007740 [Polypedilum vanderplanki]